MVTAGDQDENCFPGLHEYRLARWTVPKSPVWKSPALPCPVLGEFSAAGAAPITAKESLKRISVITVLYVYRKVLFSVPKSPAIRTEKSCPGVPKSPVENPLSHIGFAEKGAATSKAIQSKNPLTRFTANPSGTGFTAS